MSREWWRAPVGRSIQESEFRIQNGGGYEPSSPAPSVRGYNEVVVV